MPIDTDVMRVDEILSGPYEEIGPQIVEMIDGSPTAEATRRIVSHAVHRTRGDTVRSNLIVMSLCGARDPKKTYAAYSAAFPALRNALGADSLARMMSYARNQNVVVSHCYDKWAQNGAIGNSHGRRVDSMSLALLTKTMRRRNSSSSIAAAAMLLTLPADYCVIDQAAQVLGDALVANGASSPSPLRPPPEGAPRILSPDGKWYKYTWSRSKGPNRRLLTEVTEQALNAVIDGPKAAGCLDAEIADAVLRRFPPSPPLAAAIAEGMHANVGMSGFADSRFALSPAAAHNALSALCSWELSDYLPSQTHAVCGFYRAAIDLSQYVSDNDSRDSWIAADPYLDGTKLTPDSPDFMTSEYAKDCKMLAEAKRHALVSNGAQIPKWAPASTDSLTEVLEALAGRSMRGFRWPQFVTADIRRMALEAMAANYGTAKVSFEAVTPQDIAELAASQGFSKEQILDLVPVKCVLAAQSLAESRPLERIRRFAGELLAALRDGCQQFPMVSVLGAMESLGDSVGNMPTSQFLRTHRSLLTH